jgi:hypothetical protein
MLNPKILVVIFLSTLLSSCGEDPFCNCFEPTGNRVSENRPVNAFSEIEVFHNINVNLHYSNSHRVIVHGGSRLIDGIETDVEGGRLAIQNLNRCNWMRNPGNEFTVDVYTPELKEVVYRSAGDIRCIDTIRTNQFLAESWDGTGTMDLLLDCDESYLKIHTGPADIIARGETGYSFVYNTGNGYIRAGGLSAINATAISKSTGDCYVFCSSSLNAKIQYHGDVFYGGQPSSVQKEITGSGKLIPY